MNCPLQSALTLSQSDSWDRRNTLGPLVKTGNPEHHQNRELLRGCGSLSTLIEHKLIG